MTITTNFDKNKSLCEIRCGSNNLCIEYDHSLNIAAIIVNKKSTAINFTGWVYSNLVVLSDYHLKELKTFLNSLELDKNSVNK